MASAGGVCAACLRRPPAVDATWSPWRYAHPLDWLLRQAKLHQRRDLLHTLALLLRTSAPRTLSPMLMLPVPLHPRRLTERGYNQSEALFAPLCARLGVAFDSDRLTRIRDTPTQTALTRTQRRRNLRAAFAVSGPLPPVVGICDDVITTGATVDSIARLLKRHGARQVIAWSLARAT